MVAKNKPVSLKCICGLNYKVPRFGILELYCPCGRIYNIDKYHVLHIGKKERFRYTIKFPEGSLCSCDSAKDLKDALKDIPDSARAVEVSVGDYQILTLIFESRD